MADTALRKEIQSFIKAIPDEKLKILKPLLSEFAKPTYTIEPASPSECKRVEKRMKDYYKDPSSFVPLSKIK